MMYHLRDLLLQHRDGLQNGEIKAAFSGRFMTRLGQPYGGDGTVFTDPKNAQEPGGPGPYDLWSLTNMKLLELTRTRGFAPPPPIFEEFGISSTKCCVGRTKAGKPKMPRVYKANGNVQPPAPRNANFLHQPVVPPLPPTAAADGAGGDGADAPADE